MVFSGKNSLNAQIVNNFNHNIFYGVFMVKNLN